MQEPSTDAGRQKPQHLHLGGPRLSLPSPERAPSYTSQGSPAQTPTQGTLPGMGREANKEMLVRPSFIGEMPSVGRNHKMSVQWMRESSGHPGSAPSGGPGSPGAPAQCCHTCSPWQRGAEQPRPPSEGHTGDGCRGARGAGQERRPCFHQGLREVSFEATRRSMPWLLKYIDKRGRLFMSGLSSNPMP